ncbi:MAG: lipocalin family protein [Blastocatellia bacterium]|nr:lipocalin family protein [Blastocatellia bacterium]
MKNLIISAIALFLLSLAINAQGKKYSNKEHSFNFVAPAGWTVSEDSEKCRSFSLTNPNRKIAVIISAAHTLSLAEFLTKEYKVANLGYSPVTRIMEHNGMQGVTLQKTERGYRMMADAVLMPIGDTDAVAAIAIYDGNQNAQEAYNSVVQILRFVKLSFGRKLKKVFADTEKALAAQSTSKSSTTSSVGSSPNSAWGRMLSGKKLEYFKNGSSRIFRFCGGNFSQGAESLYSSNDGSYGSTNSNLSGRWDVRGNTLILRYNDGDTAEYELTQSEDTGGVRLDGQFYAMTEANCS